MSLWTPRQTISGVFTEVRKRGGAFDGLRDESGYEGRLSRWWRRYQHRRWLSGR